MREVDVEPLRISVSFIASAAVRLPGSPEDKQGDALGVEAMHGLDVIHRDLKLDNLLLKAQGAVKIADFGVAPALPASALVTDRSGTLRYQSPEIFDPSQPPFDGKSSDMWAAGVTIYELSSGLFPLRARTRRGLSAELLKAGIEVEDRHGDLGRHATCLTGLLEGGGRKGGPREMLSGSGGCRPFRPTELTNESASTKEFRNASHAWAVGLSM